MFVLRVLIGAWLALTAGIATCSAQQSLESERSELQSDGFSSDVSDQGFPAYSRSDMASYADRFWISPSVAERMAECFGAVESAVTATCPTTPWSATTKGRRSIRELGTPD